MYNLHILIQIDIENGKIVSVGAYSERYPTMNLKYLLAELISVEAGTRDAAYDLALKNLAVYRHHNFWNKLLECMNVDLREDVQAKIQKMHESFWP